MNFSNILEYVFDLEDNQNDVIDIYILHRLKRDGYIYLINCWKKIERVRKNINKSDEKKLDSYFDTYLKVYLIENDLHKGVYEYIDKLCNISNKETHSISLDFFYKFINNLEYSDLEEFILNIIGIINIINIKKYSLDNLLQFYNIIIKYPTVSKIITKSNKWTFNSANENEYFSYLGKLINKVDLFKINWFDDINRLSNTFSQLFNIELNYNIYNWFIVGINQNKHKLLIANSTEPVFSENLVINIYYILKNILNQIIASNDKCYSTIDAKFYNIENLKETDCNNENKHSIIFFLTYWYFLVSIKYIATDYNIYIKEIIYIDAKLNEICNSHWWDENYNLRVQYISKLKKKKNSYKKKIKFYKKIFDNNELVNSYINMCNIIANVLIHNKTLFNNNDIITNLLDSLININTHITNTKITNCIDLIIKLLSHKNVYIQYKSIDFLVHYITSDGINYLEYDNLKNNILHLLLDIHTKCETLQDNQFYERFEPRYHITFLIRYLAAHDFYKTSLVELFQTNPVIQEKFLICICNDISELFYEIIYNFDKLTILNNQEQNETTNIEKEDEKIKVLKLLETFNTFLMENIIIVHYLFLYLLKIENISDKIHTKYYEVIFHICRKICLNSKHFESIIKKNNINICLESYLLKFINIITVFCKADNFKKEMLDSESNYKNNIFTILINELCNNQIQSWDIYYNLVLNEIIINKSKQDDKALSEKIIPDKYLDPILNTPITDPIILPESQVILNLDTIKKHLENNNDDPFNRRPITLNQIIEYNQTDEIKEKINQFVNETKEYY